MILCRGESVEAEFSRWFRSLVAHDCGYPLSRYTCRATRVATDFLDFIAFCRCSTGVALHPLKILVSHLAPPPVPGGVAPKFGSEKVSRYTAGVAATVAGVALHCATKFRSHPGTSFPKSHFKEYCYEICEQFFGAMATPPLTGALQ